jgi:hypothetical protein
MSKDDFKRVGILIQLEVLKIDDVGKSFDLDFGLISQWIEPEASDDKDYAIMTQLFERPVWTPDLQFYGTKSEMVELLHPSFFRIKNVYYAYYNWVIVVAEVMDLRPFPFDRQMLNVEGFSINSEFVDFKPQLGIPPCVWEEHSRTAIRLKMSQDTWICEGVSGGCSKVGSDSEINLHIKVTRRPDFYMFNIVVVNFLIVLICFSVYAIDVGDYATRFSLLQNILLIAVAFKFVINSWIPNVSYLTTLDKYLLLSTGLISANIVISFALGFMDDDSAGQTNYWFTVLGVAFWGLVHVWFWCGWHLKLLTPTWEQVKVAQEDPENEDAVLVQRKLNEDSENGQDTEKDKRDSIDERIKLVR